MTSVVQVPAQRTPPKARKGIGAALQSTVGHKFLMALTGIALVGFLVAHMAGNLLVYAGQDAMNTYAKGLKSLGALLWVMRLGLLACFSVHIAAAIRLSQVNKLARPERYRYEDTLTASLASRTMIWTGLLVLTYVAFHLAHFTLGMTHPEHFALHDAQGRHDVYSMVVKGFQSPAVSLTYVAAMLATAIHLSHGFGSLWRTLGVSCGKWREGFHKLGIAIAVVLFLGFSSIPVTIWAGLVKLPGGAQ